MCARGLIVFAVLLCVSPVWAQPGTLSYQGSLLNSRGQAVPNGNYKMWFRIYDVATGGSPVWSEMKNAVPVTSGLFSTILGDTQYLPNIFLRWSNLWLEVTVDVSRNGGFELNEVFSPRQKLTGTAWESHRIEPNQFSPNLIGGAMGNGVTPGEYAATICGGGSQVTGEFNWVRGRYGIVGGGWGNIAGTLAAVVGGTSNSANGNSAFTGGGGSNAASGNYSTVPGGAGNKALGAYSFAAGRGAIAQHDGAFVWNDTSASGGAASTADNQFVVHASNGAVVCGDPIAPFPSQLLVSCKGSTSRPQLYLFDTQSDGFVRLRMANWGYDATYWDVATWGGVFNIWYNGDGQNILQLLPDDATNLLMMRNGARLTQFGVWTNNSDRTTKANFAAVDGGQVLEQIAAMPIMTWSYKGEPESVRHMGPTAQDFYAAFALGDSDKSIGTLDAEGVALAAIQGLHQLALEQSAQIGELRVQRQAQEEQIASLRQQNAEMQTRLAALEGAVARMAGEPSRSPAMGY